MWPGLRGANVLYPSFALLFLVITIMGYVAARSAVNLVERRSAVGLQVAVWGALTVQFIIHPLLADRLFVAHYALVSILTVSLIGTCGSCTEVRVPRSTR